MKYNVLVIAGTTESRQVIEKLLGENPNERILASVATELGKEMLLEYEEGLIRMVFSHFLRRIHVKRLLMLPIHLQRLYRRR